MAWFDGFESRELEVNGTTIFARHGGAAGKPPLLLVHGFPQTHAMWHRVAQHLAPHFSLVLPYLRGYGDSGKPAAGPEHAEYGKRAMAHDVAGLMSALGFETFAAAAGQSGRIGHLLGIGQLTSHVILLSREYEGEA